MRRITLYTDGGCKKIDGSHKQIGSYAYYVDESLKGSGSFKGRLTPVKCELLGVIIGLNRLLKIGFVGEVVIKLDSQIVAGMLSNKNYWEDGTYKTNVKAAMRAQRLMSFFAVKVVWIKEGSEEGNDIAHRIATARLKEKEQELCMSIS
tara:strand:+ start:127 stop:573 length:447 start_codon:yes stop_codon:yes gene_type:complete